MGCFKLFKMYIHKPDKKNTYTSLIFSKHYEALKKTSFDAF